MTASVDSAATPIDLRLLGVAVAAWCGAVAGALAAPRLAPGSDELLAGPGRRPLLLAGAVVVVGVTVLTVPFLVPRSARVPRSVRAPRAGWRTTALAWVLVLLAASGCGLVSTAAHRADPVSVLARHGATVRIVGELSAVPTPVRGGIGAPGSVVVRVRVHRVEGVRPGPGQPRIVVDVNGVVSLRAGPGWSAYPVGERLRTLVRLRPAPAGRGVDGWGQTIGTATVVSTPDRVHRVVDRLRDGLLASCRPLPQPARGLIPAVVDGDTRLVAAGTVSDLKVSSLLHLSAVSGANVAIVLSATTGLLGALRCGRILTTVLALGVLAGFVLVADSAPSVLRAGVTAGLGLLGARRGGSGTGIRVLATAATLLVVSQPGLGTDAGFGLSVCATLAILLGSARFTGALGEWLPSPLAAAAGISVAAQLGAQPILGLLSGQFSLVGPVANVLAAPAVAPVTLLGLLAAVLQPVAPWAASVAAAAAVPGAWWLAEVARVCARLPGAALGWPAGGAGAVLALGLAALGFWVGPRILRRRVVALPAIGVLLGFLAGPRLP